MATETNSLELCKDCINSHKSFVLQGGAGSGKTESLKELLLYIKESQPKARVVCITHTNAAVEEIVSRVGDTYYISTIHSLGVGGLQCVARRFGVGASAVETERFALGGIAEIGNGHGNAAVQHRAVGQ